MGGNFTRLEESRLKKPSHVEINNDEEEEEEWDEKDKVEYERNKQFEKFIFKEKPIVVVKEIQEEVDWMNYMDAKTMKTVMKMGGDVFAITNEKPNVNARKSVKTQEQFRSPN